MLEQHALLILKVQGIVDRGLRVPEQVSVWTVENIIG